MSIRHIRLFLLFSLFRYQDSWAQVTVRFSGFGVRHGFLSGQHRLITDSARRQNEMPGYYSTETWRFQRLKKPFFSLHGSVQVESMVSDRRNTYQSVPASYLRFFISQELNIGGLPFRFGTGLSTEHRINQQHINAFNFSFDQQAYRSYLTEQLRAAMKAEAAKQLRNRYSQSQQLQMDQDIGRMELQLQDSQYQAHIAKCRVLTAPELDTMGMDSLSGLRRKLAMADVQAYELKRQRLDSLQESRRRFHLDRQQAALDTEKDLASLDNPAAFNKKLKEYGLSNNKYKALLALNRVDLGTFSPEYGTLVLNRMSVMGAGLEYNPAYWYAGLSAGKLMAYNTTLPFQNQLNQRQAFIAAKLGLGRLNGSYMGVNLLRSKGGETNTPADTGLFAYWQSQGVRGDNMVLGLEGQYAFKDVFQLRAELAASNNALPSTGSGADASQKQNLFGDAWSRLFSGKSKAVSVQAKYHLKKSKTKVQAEYRRVDPFYFSSGTPYLRRDHVKYQARVNQPLLKQLLTVSVFLRHERDNISRLKQYSTETTLYGMDLALRPRKLPFVLLNYAPARQYIRHAYAGLSYYNRIQLWVLSSGYQYKIAYSRAGTTLSFMQQRYRSNNERLNSLTRQISADQFMVLANKPDLTYSLRISFSIPSGPSDTSRIFSMTHSMSAMPGKNTRLGVSYSWQEDQLYLQRQGYSIFFRYNAVKLGNLELKAERNAFRYKQAGPGPLRQHVFYLTYTKRF